MTCFRVTMLLVLFLAASPAARAAGLASTAMDAPACQGIVETIAKATGSRLDHISFVGAFAVLLHRDLEELAVSCPPGHGSVSIEGDLQSAYPQPGFFRTLGQAGAVLVAEPAPVVEAALRRCYQSALRDDDETAVVQTGSLHVECQAYLREDSDMMIVISRAPSLLTRPARYPRAPSPTHGVRVGPVE